MTDKQAITIVAMGIDAGGLSKSMSALIAQYAAAGIDIKVISHEDILEPFNDPPLVVYDEASDINPEAFDFFTQRAYFAEDVEPRVLRTQRREAYDDFLTVAPSALKGVPHWQKLNGGNQPRKKQRKRK